MGGKSFIAKKGATIFAPRGIPHTYRSLGQTAGRLMCIITPAGFEGFFKEIGALNQQQPQDIPRVMEIAKNRAGIIAAARRVSATNQKSRNRITTIPTGL